MRHRQTKRLLSFFSSSSSSFSRFFFLFAFHRNKFFHMTSLSLEDVGQEKGRYDAGAAEILSSSFPSFASDEDPASLSLLSSIDKFYASKPTIAALEQKNNPFFIRNQNSMQTSQPQEDKEENNKQDQITPSESELVKSVKINSEGSNNLFTTIAVPLFLNSSFHVPSIPNPNPHPLKFRLNSTSYSARAGEMFLPHGRVTTPVFMPVGTQGTIKGLTSEQVNQMNCNIILGNTYHLGLRPGADTVAAAGGLHKFMNWKNPVDGVPTLLTPERSMHIQNLLGADIMMALDDVCSSSQSTPKRFVEAMHRTIRWLDRSILAHARPNHQALFGIVQGGLDKDLRSYCLSHMIDRDAWLSGYAIGGLAGGEDKNLFWKVVHQCCEQLPTSKPRYLMGVGYPLDLVVCSALGVDMFDCVWPCRTARFGSALLLNGMINLRRSVYSNDNRPIDSTCKCVACKNYTRSYLSQLITKTPLACHLITIHNLITQQRLMNSMRDAILAGDKVYSEWMRNYMRGMFPRGSGDCPAWVKEAIKAVGMQLGEWGESETSEKPKEEELKEEKWSEKRNSRDERKLVKGEEQEKEDPAPSPSIRELELERPIDWPPEKKKKVN